ncbi:hypothetical protein SH449x_002849 [Pirellulaceae bacterium SH449]
MEDYSGILNSSYFFIHEEELTTTMMRRVKLPSAARWVVEGRGGEENGMEGIFPQPCWCAASIKELVQQYQDQR